MGENLIKMWSVFSTWRIVLLKILSFALFICVNILLIIQLIMEVW